MFVYWLVAAASGADAYASAQEVFAHPLTRIALVGFSFAFFYHLFPDINRSRLAMVHFWLTAVSGIVMLVSLFFIFGGNTAAEPITGIASIVFFLGILLFAWIALPVLRRAV